MKKINVLLFVLIFIGSFNGYSQEIETKQKSPFWSHVQFGGGVDMGFGNGYTTLGLSPSAIYNFSEKFSTGLSVSYLYSKNEVSDRIGGGRYDVESNVYGGSVLAFYNPFRGIQFSGEFEQTEAEYKRSGYDSEKRSIPAMYFGVAYRMGRNVSMGIRYDALYDENKSLYSSAFTPMFSVYF